MVFGCAAAIATSSMTTELAKGKTLDDAYKITEEDIAHALGGLPEYKMHCSVLGVAALKNAITNYYTKNFGQEYKNTKENVNVISSNNQQPRLKALSVFYRERSQMTRSNKKLRMDQLKR